MIKSLPELPKSMKGHPYYKGWRRKAGVLRAMFELSTEAYSALVTGTLETEEERSRAISKILRYTQYASMMSERVGTGKESFDLLGFIHNDENWK